MRKLEPQLEELGSALKKRPPYASRRLWRDLEIRRALGELRCRQFPLFRSLADGRRGTGRDGRAPRRIEAWAANYAAVHELPLAGADECEQRDVWHERLAGEGREAVLEMVLPGLVAGIGAAAFHAAIRAGYAVERNDDRELACALTAWQCDFLALTAPEQPAWHRSRGTQDPGALDDSRRTPRPDRLAHASRREGSGLCRHCPSVPQSADLDELALAAAAAFGECGEFYRAARDDRDPRDALPAEVHPGSRGRNAGLLGRAYAAAALVAGTIPTLEADRLAALRAGAPRGWEDLLSEAVAHDDEHVIKSTYTAWRLDNALRDPVFRTAARRYINQETYR